MERIYLINKRYNRSCRGNVHLAKHCGRSGVNKEERRPNREFGNTEETFLKPGSCYICQKPGHWARECRERGSQRNKRDEDGEIYRRNNEELRKLQRSYEQAQYGGQHFNSKRGEGFSGYRSQENNIASGSRGERSIIQRSGGEYVPRNTLGIELLCCLPIGIEGCSKEKERSQEEKFKKPLN